MPTHRRSTAAAVATAALALAAPAASARPAIDPPARAHVAPAPSDGGIEWGSTALGAGGATLVLLLTGAGAATVSRRRHAKVPAAS
jgi:hypothetical protein